MIRYRLGELNQRVTLESATDAEDGSGGSDETWSTYATVWAKVTPMQGREGEAGSRREATSAYVIVIRNRDDVEEGDRIGWRGRKLNVTFVRGRGVREQFMEIEATLGGSS